MWDRTGFRDWVGAAAGFMGPVSAGGVHIGGVRFGNVRVDLRIGVHVPLLGREGVTPPCGNNRNSQQNPMSGLRLRD